MTGKEKSRGSPAPISLLDFSPSWKLMALWGESEQGMAVEMGMRGDRQVGHAAA